MGRTSLLPDRLERKLRVPSRSVAVVDSPVVQTPLETDPATRRESPLAGCCSDNVSQPLLRRIDYRRPHVGYRVDDPRHPPHNHHRGGIPGLGLVTRRAFFLFPAQSGGSREQRRARYSLVFASVLNFSLHQCGAAPSQPPAHRPKLRAQHV
jgi:hypothetical protein